MRRAGLVGDADRAQGYSRLSGRELDQLRHSTEDGVDLGAVRCEEG